MTMLTFSVDLDDEKLSEFDALAATKGHDRNSMIAQLIEEFLQLEPDVAGYDAWFRDEGEDGLADSENADASFYKHDDVMAEMKAVILTRSARVQKRAG